MPQDYDIFAKDNIFRNNSGYPKHKRYCPCGEQLLDERKNLCYACQSLYIWIVKNPKRAEEILNEIKTSTDQYELNKHLKDAEFEEGYAEKKSKELASGNLNTIKLELQKEGIDMDELLKNCKKMIKEELDKIRKKDNA